MEEKGARERAPARPRAPALPSLRATTCRSKSTFIIIIIRLISFPAPCGVEAQDGSSGWKLPARHPGSGLSPFPPCSDGDERLVLSGLGPVQDSPQRLTPGTGSACFPPAAGLGAAPSAERQSAARSFCMSGEQRRTGYIITLRPHTTQYRLTIQLNVH